MPSLRHTWWRRIPDLVVVSILLLGGAFLGVELLAWYRGADRRPLPSPDPLAHLGAPGLPTGLVFGDLSVELIRQVENGSREQAQTVLSELVRGLLAEAVPASGQDDAERELLAKLSRRKPFEEQPDQWRLYALDDQFSLMVAVRPARHLGLPPLQWPRPELAPGGDGSHRLPVGDMAHWRIVAWGLLAGTADDVWSLYAFRGTQQTPYAKTSADLNHPPDAVRTMSIRDATGNRLTHWTGSGTVQSLQQFYEQALSEREYVAAPGWRGDARRIWGRFEHQPEPGNGSEQAVIEILLQGVDGTRWNALVTESSVASPGD